MKAALILSLFFTFIAGATSVCIDSNTVRVRAAPNSKAKVLWIAPKLSPFVYLKQKGPWILVKDMDGVEGWIIFQSTTQKYRCAAVKTNFAMAYTEPHPDKADNDYLRLDRYWPLKRLDKKDGWYKVEDLNRRTFWAREEDLWIPIKQVSLEL